MSQSLARTGMDTRLAAWITRLAELLAATYRIESPNRWTRKMLSADER